MSRPARPVIDRLLEKIIQGESDCWIFAGYLDRFGYGKVSLDGRPLLVHRVTYEYFRAEIPAGLVLDHLCRVTACCNPWHVEPVTQWVNMLRGEPARRTHCRRGGHELTPDNTDIKRSTSKPGVMRACKTCRRERARLQRNARRAVVA